MRNEPKLAKSEKLLIAACNLVSRGRRVFTAEDLVVEAHRAFGSDFALKGYPKYPDSNLVLTQLMGTRAPLITRGWLEKTGTKRYQLTAKGAHDATKLGSRDVQATASKVGRDLEARIGQIISSDALLLWEDNRREEITFHQFCKLVGLSPRDPWQRVSGKLQGLLHTADEALALGAAGEVVRIHFRRRNTELSPARLKDVHKMIQFLIQRFREQMEQWKAMASDRKRGAQ